MTKDEYIDYWKISAEKSWQVAHDLFDKADFVESLFFAHLALEKLLKAHWVRDNKNDFPPRTHNLRHLVSQINLVFSVEETAFLELMTTFQLEGRYPDAKFTIYQRFDQQATKAVLDEAAILYEWLLNKMP